MKRMTEDELDAVGIQAHESCCGMADQLFADGPPDYEEVVDALTVVVLSGSAASAESLADEVAGTSAAGEDVAEHVAVVASELRRVAERYIGDDEQEVHT